MCGIIALDCLSHIDRSRFVNMLRDSADRGQDSTGACVIMDDGVLFSHRSLGDVDKWESSVPHSFWAMYDHARFVLGVNRAQPVPEGDSTIEVNRQPITYGNWVGVHNGTFGNDGELRSEYGFNTRTQIDTEVAIALLDMLWDGTNESVKNWARKLSGGMAFIGYNFKSHHFIVAKNFKPLCYALDYGYNIVWASERKTLEAGGFGDISWVPPYTAFVDSLHNRFSIETLHETTIPVSDSNKALVVTSGGIDSSTAAYVAAKLHNKELTLVHFNYGQIAQQREWKAVCRVANDLNCSKMDVDISWLGKLVDTPLVSTNAELPLGIKSVETTGCWVPARNLVMLSITAGICESLGIGCIYSGFNLEEAGCFPDNDIEFLKVFNLALSYGTLRRPKLVLALERLMKPEIIKLGDYLGVSFGHTWSCDRGGDLPCGQCGCCWMRQFAFKRARVEDTQEYLNPPLERVVWEGSAISDVAPIDDILKRVKQVGLDDLMV